MASEIHNLLTRKVVVSDAPAVVGEDDEVPDDEDGEVEGDGLIEVEDNFTFVDAQIQESILSIMCASQDETFQDSSRGV